MSTPKFRPLQFGVTRVRLRDGAPGTHYLRAEQDLQAYPERLSRGLVLVKWWLLAIPHYLVVTLFVSGAVYAYDTGAGGTVTQNTNKTTGVTLNTPVGFIAGSASAGATFTVKCVGPNNWDIFGALGLET